MSWLLSVAIPALASQVSVSTPDGLTLSADQWGSGATGVVLIHDGGRSRADWGLIGPKLAQSGVHVLAVDLRGHGGSVLPAPLAEADWVKLIDDVAAGVAWLEAHGATEIHLVGAGVGANLALNAAPRSTAVKDVVLLSPSLVAHGVKVSTAIPQLGARSLLAVAAADDAMAVKASTWLVGQATGPKLLSTVPGTASGTKLLIAAPELETALSGWVGGGFHQTAPTAAATAAPALKTEVEAIETTGTRLEDRKR